MNAQLPERELAKRQGVVLKTQVLFVLSAYLMSCQTASEETVEVEKRTDPFVWGADDRESMDDTFFSANPTALAFGHLTSKCGEEGQHCCNGVCSSGIVCNRDGTWDLGVCGAGPKPGGLGCSATYIGNNYVITNSHCIPKDYDLGKVVFRPGYVGVTNDLTNIARRPQISLKRGVRGTGSAGRFDTVLSGSTFRGTYYPGGDWLVLEVDPSTFVRGSGGAGLPNYPTSWGVWPSIPLAAPPNPISQPFSVTSWGYSVDRYGPPAFAPSRHASCQARRDGVCNPGQSSEGDGIVLVNCEFASGASGGPIIQGWPSNPSIVALNAANGTNAACYISDSYANRAVSTNAFVNGPWNAGGLTFTTMGNGVTLAVASDLDRLGGLYWNNFDSTDGYHPIHAWRPWGDGSASGFRFGRLASTLASDNRAWIFALRADGELMTRVEGSTPGSWGGWSANNPSLRQNSASSEDIIDVEAASAAASGVVVQVYSLHRSGAVRTRRKTGSSDAAWSSTSFLVGTSQGKALAVGVGGGYQQLFLMTDTSVASMWETSAGSNNWTSWYTFSDGLPVGLSLVDITAGLDSGGRMEVHLLTRNPSTGQAIVYRRRKVSARAQSAWGPWSPMVQGPASYWSTQVECGPVFANQTRLGLVDQGALMSRRLLGDLSDAGWATSVDIVPQVPDPNPEVWVPAFVPEPTPTNSCPPQDVPVVCQ